MFYLNDTTYLHVLLVSFCLHWNKEKKRQSKIVISMSISYLLFVNETDETNKHQPRDWLRNVKFMTDYRCQCCHQTWYTCHLSSPGSHPLVTLTGEIRQWWFAGIFELSHGYISRPLSRPFLSLLVHKYILLEFQVANAP